MGDGIFCPIYSNIELPSKPTKSQQWAKCKIGSKFLPRQLDFGDIQKETR